MIKVTKKWALSLFKETVYEKSIKSIKGKLNDFICFSVQTEQEYKTSQQNRLWHSILREFWNSGQSSFSSYKNMRDSYKERAGLISLEKMDMSNELRQAQLKLYHLLPSGSLKEEQKSLIYSGRKIIHSIADATKEEMHIIIGMTLDDIAQAGVSSKKLDDIIKELDG